MADNKALRKSPDAQFRFAMSRNGMTLGVSRYFPPNGGRGPSVELIREQVAEAGVQLPVDEEAAQRVVDAIEQGQEYTGIALVRGIPATEPQDGALLALGDLEYPVFPEDRFVRYRPPQEAKAGQTINGLPLEPREDFTPKDTSVQVGDNVEWDPATESYVSKVWGIAHLKDGVISVNEIPRITDDAVMVMANLHHKDFKGEPITPARLDKEMRDAGVIIDMDMDLIDAKLKQAADLGMPLFDQVLIQGSHPIPGRDGWLEYMISTREETGTEDEAGRLDFRNRGSYPIVNPGQIIGRLHPPTAGEGGIDIYGKTVPAHAGKELHVRLGENVSMQEDGLTYQSKAKGVVVMDRNELSVTECLVIPGNIDLNSGNVAVEDGSIMIHGSIQAGFSVKAPKHVIVKGAVESASVYAGGLVEIMGGILMPEGGQVVSDGEVIASYAINANIKARGDVTIGNEITNSTIQTDGKLIATAGKGIVQGGAITTRKGAEINEIGSELGIATTIAVDMEHSDDEELREERKKITQAVRKIDDALGTDDPQVILMRTPQAKRDSVAEVLKHRGALVKRRKSITKQINQLLESKQRELEGINIKVKKLIHPGTTIRFGKMAHEIKKRCEASTLFWDLGNRQIGIK